MTSPNFATLSESPIIKTLFIIGTAGAARFYRAVGALGRLFIEIEAEALRMD